MKTVISIIISLALLCPLGYASAQAVNIRFVPVFDGEGVEAGKNYYLAAIGDSVSFETLKLYISGLALLSDKQVRANTPKCFLVDISQPETQTIAMSIDAGAPFDALQFNIGVDSATNVSGAMGGDLDPMNGMYWAWQSGYINFKLEGKSPVCLTRQNSFQYHIGGYAFPDNSLQTVVLPVSDNSVNVYIHLGKILSQVDLRMTNEVMSPGEKALRLSAVIAKNFTTTPR